MSYKSLGPKVNKMNGDQAEETAPAPALKLPDSEDEHKDEEEVEMESNDEVAKVIFSDDDRNFWKKTCVKMTDFSFFSWNCFVVFSLTQKFSVKPHILLLLTKKLPKSSKSE